MVLPISGGPIRDSFDGWTNAVTNLKSDCLLAQANTAAGASASIQVFLQIALDALTFVQIHDAIAAKPAASVNAFVAYAQTQWPGTTFTVTDFVNARNSANAMYTTIKGAYPHDGSSRLLDRSFSDTTGLSWVTTTAGAIPSVMNAIASFLATLS